MYMALVSPSMSRAVSKGEMSFVAHRRKRPEAEQSKELGRS
jgi:hypothetical protein